MTTIAGLDNKESFDEVCRFLIKLGKDAHSYGSTTGNLEKSLLSITQSFGFHGSFQITPGEIIFAFQEDESHPQRIHLTNLPFAAWTSINWRRSVI